MPTLIGGDGLVALQIAAMRPPELKAIMPMGCVVNRATDDAHYMGGAYGEQNMAWGTSFKGDMAAPPDPKVVGADWETLWRQRLEATPSIMRTWTAHQTYDDYWKRGSIATEPHPTNRPIGIPARAAYELDDLSVALPGMMPSIQTRPGYQGQPATPTSKNRIRRGHGEPI